jgi:hypothetical protein
MPTEADLVQQSIQLQYAMGECISAWANVELRLMILFQFLLGGDGRIADAVLATPRNFEVRSAMVHNVMRIRLKDRPVLDDWNLVYNYTIYMSSRRNEIAHATMVNETDVGIVLKPYFVLFGHDKPYLKVETVKERARDFLELTQCLNWFVFQLPKHPEQPPVPAVPIPDLLLRLRTEDDQRREEQRARQKPSPL